MTTTMLGVRLPGNREVTFDRVERPVPGSRQVLLRMRASSICGSDIRAIYREHVGQGDEAYQDVIAGHEPAGEIVAVGPDCRRFGVGDRVLVYHISGCGVCPDCRAGYMISCTSPTRAAYGWQRDGGHAEYMLAEENTLIGLPDELSYVDGALIACGFGTAYEALLKAGVSGRDRVLVTGIGPVGMAAGLLAKAMGSPLVIGVDVSRERLDWALEIGAIDRAVVSGDTAVEEIRALTGGHGCEVSVDCSGSGAARLVALAATRHHGRCVLVGEGNRLEFDVSPMLIHPQITLFGSWVTSVGHMEELVEKLVTWGLRPEITVSHRFSLQEAHDAYRVADGGQAGKVCIVMDGEQGGPLPGAAVV
ncbi:MAG: Hypothetical zinc-type alcohol dehydrogenase-like protein YphC [uncultured Thermomicrobiales bacterium]|uniref:Hypothetical zinc-type alcohol dehydrogenase-like protein YphC n=1 Tax=uncultured Thermomicrobiales bacterium TaxID=1645740 RepID=A0A6J4UX42_9BACT|nr:MAG: Hypothetical zinc-type alcohol dehydrogenase-like protein YphC [uncultured Thermomicrobiales bacterium]